MKQIVLYASELAACLGRNPYVKIDEAVARVAARVRGAPPPAEVAAAAVIAKIGPDDAHALVAHAGASRDAAEALAHAAHAESVVRTAIKQKYALSESDTDVLEKHVRAVHYTEHGTHNEHHVRAVNSRTIKKDNTYRQKVLFEDTNTRVWIGGRHDGVTRLTDAGGVTRLTDAGGVTRLTDAGGSDAIVEIKNRMRRLFGRVVEYERIQLMAYMYIHDVPRGLLIEQYRRDSREYRVDFDAAYWSDIIARGVPTFVSMYTQCMHEK